MGTLVGFPRHVRYSRNCFTSVSLPVKCPWPSGNFNGGLQSPSLTLCSSHYPYLPFTNKHWPWDRYNIISVEWLNILCIVTQYEVVENFLYCAPCFYLFCILYSRCGGCWVLYSSGPETRPLGETATTGQPCGSKKLALSHRAEQHTPRRCYIWHTRYRLYFFPRWAILPKGSGWLTALVRFVMDHRYCRDYHP